jgi:hypothetical protein
VRSMRSFADMQIAFQNLSRHVNTKALICAWASIISGLSRLCVPFRELFWCILTWGELCWIQLRIFYWIAWSSSPFWVYFFYIWTLKLLLGDEYLCTSSVQEECHDLVQNTLQCLK